MSGGGLETQLDRPYRVILHSDRPTTATPEPGWSSQCRHPECPGHWRTGLDSEDEARRAYAGHRCASDATP